MTAELNLHEVVREALAPVRAAHPDRLVDVEHRGEGDGDGDAAALCAALEAIFRAVFASAAGDGSIWIRSSGVAADFAVLVEYEGVALDLVGVNDALRTVDGAVSLDGVRLRVTLPRHR